MRASLFHAIAISVGALIVACGNRTHITSGETCTGCHAVVHPGDVHTSQPCSSCHAAVSEGTKGPPETPGRHHMDRIAIPGNLSNAERTCGLCHAEQVWTVTQSLMTTNSAMIATNRFAFKDSFSESLKESPAQSHERSAHADIGHLSPASSAADSYFTQLCSSCHLGLAKTRTGPVHGYEKGGGCLACHLEHNPTSRLRKTPDDTSCFLCHSRSGRISLNYNGYGEMDPDERGAPVRVLPDGRRLKQLNRDVHKTKGMTCVDCHKSRDAMGDGHSHSHKEQAVQTKCEDCHGTDRHPNDRANHARLSCTSCHTAWAPNCFGCHISYERRPDGSGSWVETEGETLYRPPALGATEDGRIRPFVPGMKMTIDRSGFTGQEESLIHRVLFAPAAPHTITREGRSCLSCHRDPFALGFGDGKLKYANGRWIFQPAYRIIDGLPEDAWIVPFHETTNQSVSTRKGARPFNVREQEKILAVGRCLECHDGKARLFSEFAKARNHHHASP